MEPKPKERIVFDEDLYYGDEGEEMAINDLMERDGLTEDEVREDFTDDEIFNHQMEMKDFDYEEEMRALAAFFNGEKSDMSDFVNPYGGNHILVSGSVGRWNGTSTMTGAYPSRCVSSPMRAMGIEEKAAECKEAATVLANGNAL